MTVLQTKQQVALFIVSQYLTSHGPEKSSNSVSALFYTTHRCVMMTAFLHTFKMVKMLLAAEFVQVFHH